MSKTVITSAGDGLKSSFDKRFGRAEYFCVYDKDTRETYFIKNEFADSKQGAGTKVAELMFELKAETIISGDFGPKAKEILDKLKIQMVLIDDSASIEEIITKLS